VTFLPVATGATIVVAFVEHRRRPGPRAKRQSRYDRAAASCLACCSQA
jgi:hypothetical protein